MNFLSISSHKLKYVAEKCFMFRMFVHLLFKIIYEGSFLVIDYCQVVVIQQQI